MAISQKFRLIDKIDGGRTSPMRILVLGAPKTGTSSMRAALTHLGFRCYHFRDLMLDYKRNVPLWTEGIQAKYFGYSRSYGREEFDKLIGDYDAVLDDPALLFVDELVEAYPDAKIILTLRPADLWMMSVRGTLLSRDNSIIFRLFYWIDPVMRLSFPLYKLCSGFWEYDSYHARENLLKHNNHVRSIVPAENLLEFHVGEGYEKLCSFLDIPMPKKPFPHSNESTVYQQRQFLRKRNILCRLAKLMITITIALDLALMSHAWYIPDAAALKTTSGLVFGLVAAIAFPLFNLGECKDIEKELHRGRVEEI